MGYQETQTQLWIRDPRFGVVQCVVSIVPRAVAHRGQFPMILASSSMAHLPKNHSKMHENGLWRKIFFACGALIGAPP